MKGTALMYYGEEIGMATLPKSALNDFPTGPKRPRADDRDGARVLMASPAARVPASTEFSVAPFGVVVSSSVR